MSNKPKSTPVQRDKNKLRELKELLVNELDFLRQQRNLPYTLPDQQTALDAQIAVLEKYL